MIFVEKDVEPSYNRDLKIYAKSKECDNINLNIISQHLDPMTYVLFYLDGKPGWNRYRINSTNNDRISMSQNKLS